MRATSNVKKAAFDANSLARRRQANEAMFDAALGYAARGFYVFPVPPGAKKSYIKGNEAKGIPKWGMTRNPDRIRSYFKKWPRANIGIVTGFLSGIFVVDADTLSGHGVDGITNFKALVDQYGLPATLMAESPSGSQHHVFNHPGAGIMVMNSTGTATAGIAPGVDVRGDGGMFLAAPSTVTARAATADKPPRSGGTYRWLNALPPAEAPEWVLAIVMEKDPNRAKRAAHAAAPAAGLAAAAAEQAPDTNAFTDYGHETLTRDRQSDGDIDIEKMRAALAVIPNDAGVGWKDWCDIGLTIYAATSGSAAGEELFDEWSRIYPGYNAADTAARWAAMHGSPPTQLGVGSLYYRADQASPIWRQEYDTAPLSDTCAAIEPDSDELHAAAVLFYDEAVQIQDTLADSYLDSIGIKLPKSATEALRFHPGCRFGDRVLPCLMALISDVTLPTEDIGLQLTALDASGAAIGRMVIGSAKGGAINLGGHPHATGELTIATSLENALAAVMEGFSPASAVLSNEGITNFPWRSYQNPIRHLNIIIEVDVDGTSAAAADRCREVWGKHAVTLLIPDELPGQDARGGPRAIDFSEASPDGVTVVCR